MTTPAALRDAGQARSLFDLDVSHTDAFMAIILAIPAGQQVHVNGLRDALDEIGIPAKVRGGLFSQAVRAGLLAPVLTLEGYSVRVPSSGLSAHAASVRLYVRTATS